MANFLHGTALSEKIREVVKGKDVRCAVAFWGGGAVQELFGTEVLDRDDVHVVCDLSMGGTNPDTLRALGAPENQNIRFSNGLHAKVFMSSNGAIVGSANASNNGIGFMGSNAQLLEAGTYFGPVSDACSTVSDWFADLANYGSKQVDMEALNTARLAWNRRRNAGGRHNVQQRPSFLSYDPEVDKPVLVCWYVGGGNQAMDDPRIADEGRSYMYFSDEREEILDHWVCAFRVSDDGRQMHPNGQPSFFFVTDFLKNSLPNEEYDPNLAFQHVDADVPDFPFALNRVNFNNAFRSVIDRNEYRRLRDEDSADPWLVRNHIDPMHRFWRDVQAEYRRLQDEL